MHPAMNNLNRFKAMIFRALADPKRLEIIEYLRRGERCVCEIIPYVELAQPMVSRHLAILKKCGLVKYRKHGNKRFYSITSPTILKVIDVVNANFADALLKHVVEHIA